MNMPIRGASGGTVFGTQLSIKSTNPADTGNRNIRYTTRKNGKTKKLNYNSREISDQLLRVSKARSASEVLVRAKEKVGMLQMCLGTGQYDDREVRAAVAHARRIVRCAQMKVRNLKEEEEIKRKSERGHNGDEREKKNEVRCRISRKKADLKAETAQQGIREGNKEKAEQLELQRKRRLHRNTERAKINEADMKYMGERNENSKGIYSVGYNEVVVDLSAAALRMHEIYMAEQEIRKMEQEAERETDVEMQAMEISGEFVTDAAGSCDSAGGDAGMSGETHAV